MPVAQSVERCFGPTVHATGINMSMPVVKTIRPTPAGVTAETERAKHRYLRLLEELCIEERAPERGWQTRVAARLGINQSFVSRLRSRQRTSIGSDSIDKAVAGLRIRRAYFYDLREPLSYKEYMGKEPTFPGWREFLEGPFAQDMTDDERHALATFAVPYGGVPTAAFYEGTLHMMRGRITRAQFDAGLARANELHARLKKKRKPAGRDEDDGALGD